MDWFVNLGIALALFGAWLNAEQRIEGFLVWMVSNFILFAYNVEKHLYSQALLFLIYTLLCIKGIVDWKAKEKSR